MKRLTIDKYYKYIGKLDNLEIKEFLKDSVVAYTYHLNNGEVGFVPKNKEYAYVLQNENAIEENWGKFILTISMRLIMIFLTLYIKSLIQVKKLTMR